MKTTTGKCDRCPARGKLATTPTGSHLCAACHSLERVTAAGSARAIGARPRPGASARQCDAFRGRDVRGTAPQLDLFAGRAG